MKPVLITAGATRNPVDEMRFLSAYSSGRTGVALARALGGRVTLLASPEAALRCNDGPVVVEFGSTRDLMARMAAWCADHPDAVVIHAAAVGDYEAVEASGKIPSGQPELLLRLVPAPKILDRMRSWSADLRIVSFKAAPPGTAPDQLATIADAQRKRTDSALVFANTIGRTSTDVVLVDAAGATHHASRADGLADLVARVHAMR